MPEWPVRFDLHVDLSDDTLARPALEAEALASVLSEIPLSPSTRLAFARLNIARAVRGTTGLEGVDLTEAEVTGVLAAPASGSVLSHGREREEHEVRNAARVMTFVQETLDADPGAELSEEFIRELHRLTTGGIAYAHNEPGQYRRHAVSAGSYIPPRDPDDIRRLMSEFIAWTRSPQVRSWPAVVRAAAAHFYFISIHPFGDGNGRTARAIESFFLYQRGMNLLGFYSLANFYYRNRARYIELLDEVRFLSGDSLNPFLRFAATGLLEELRFIRDEVLQANRSAAFRDFSADVLAATLIAAKVRARLTVLMRTLLSEGAIDESLVRAGHHPLGALYIHIGASAFGRDLRKLTDLGLVLIEGGTIRPNYRRLTELD